MTVWYKRKGRDRLGDDQAGPFSSGNRSGDIAYTHGIGGIDSAGIECLVRCQTHLYAAESHYEPHVSRWG